LEYFHEGSIFVFGASEEYDAVLLIFKSSFDVLFCVFDNSLEQERLDEFYEGILFIMTCSIGYYFTIWQGFVSRLPDLEVSEENNLRGASETVIFLAL